MKAAIGKVKHMTYSVYKWTVKTDPTKVIAASIMAGGFYLGMGNMPASQITINNYPPSVTVKERPIVIERMRVKKGEIKTVPKK
jgi:hypothetical protein